MKKKMFFALIVFFVCLIPFSNKLHADEASILFVDSSNYPLVRIFVLGLSQNTSGYEYAIIDTEERVTSQFSIGSDISIPVNMIFVLDTTGSMRENLGIAKDKISYMAKRFSDRSLDYTLSLVTYGDEVNFANGFLIDPPDMIRNNKAGKKYPLRSNDFDFPLLLDCGPTTSINTFKKWVSIVPDVSGNDGKENALDALAATLTLPVEPLSPKVVNLITDVNYHKPGENGDGRTKIPKEQLIDAMKENYFNVNVILANSSFQNDYADFVQDTGGNLYNLHNNLGAILDKITDYIVSIQAITYVAPNPENVFFRYSALVKIRKSDGAILAVGAPVAYSPLLE